MKKLFLLITLLLIIPATHAAAPLEEVPPYVNKVRAQQIRNEGYKTQRGPLFFPDTRDKVSNLNKARQSFALKAVDALESPSMTNLKKLDAVCGDHLWQDRKAIIRHMIDHNIDVNTIIYQYSMTPLKDSVQSNDLSFTHYLLQLNADVDRIISDGNTALQTLVLQHNHALFSTPDVGLALLKLLIFNNANPDLEIPIYRTIRNYADAATRVLIKQVEQEKTVREFLLIAARITDNPSLIAINYLYPNFNVSKEGITLAEQNIAFDDHMLAMSAEQIDEVD